MRPSRRRRRSLRVARLEPIEPRLLFSANPAADFRLDYLVENLPASLAMLTGSAADTLTGLSEIRAEYGFSGRGQTVAVIDSGIAYRHAALGGGFGPGYRVAGGFDFSERDRDPYDDGPVGSHGTHVAGIIGSSDPLHPGVAPGVDLVALRVFDDGGQGNFSSVEQALQWVHVHRNDFRYPIRTVNLSLGADWNSSQPPPWAPLEDEFTQLEADGVFISVAAGNSFTNYNEPGLSYPAVSPHVVPVASVDDTGAMSYFSQRHERVIAAPGRGVLSTVPDYVGNRNGVDDDFARYSGTSMAAPYVAAASVLVRQAYQFVGMADVSQWTIYNLMVNTADTLSDPATGQNYHRLNLGRAIDSIMPADDFGSTAAAAYRLGTITDTRSLNGAIARLDDQDWFSFTAGRSGTMTFSVDTAEDLLPAWQLSGAARTTIAPDNRALSFSVVAGQSYTVGLGARNSLGHYTLRAALDSASGYVDWGTVAQKRFDGSPITPEGQWFTVTAAATGTLTVEAFFSNAAGDVDLQVFDRNQRLLGSAHTTADLERVDIAAVAGVTYTLRAYSYDGLTNDQVGFRVTNLVSRDGSAVSVSGTDADDSFVFNAGRAASITINGVSYQLDAAVTSVAFDGKGGSDAAVLNGTGGDDAGELRPGSARLSGAGYQVEVAHMETVTLRGGAGSDRVALYDSPGDDSFVAAPGFAALTGNGFGNRAEGFEAIRAYATSGADLAKLYDSPGNDEFVAAPRYAALSGRGFAIQAEGFDVAHAYASAGFDTAKLFDSVGSDTFYASPQEASLYGAGYYNRAKSFDAVHAYSVSGGRDVAYLYDSAGNDTLYVDSIQAALYGTGFYNRAKFFAEVHAASLAGGRDQALLSDSAGDDQFQAAGKQAKLVTGGSTAWLEGFQYVRAQSQNGGRDKAAVAAVDYVLELGGRWA